MLQKNPKRSKIRFYLAETIFRFFIFYFNIQKMLLLVLLFTIKLLAQVNMFNEQCTTENNESSIPKA